jgi:hypothetical protein
MIRWDLMFALMRTILIFGLHQKHKINAKFDSNAQYRWELRRLQKITLHDDNVCTALVISRGLGKRFPVILLLIRGVEPVLKAIRKIVSLYYVRVFLYNI